MSTLQATIQKSSDRFFQQSRQIIEQAVATSKGKLDQVKDVLEDEKKDVVARLQTLEMQSQSIIQDTVQTAADQVLKVEKDFQSKAKDLAQQVRPKVVARVPQAELLFDSVEKGLAEIDQRLKSAISLVKPRTALDVIPSYVELGVKDISQKLPFLSREDLQIVRSFEIQNKNRVTVLRAIDELI